MDNVGLVEQFGAAGVMIVGLLVLLRTVWGKYSALQDERSREKDERVQDYKWFNELRQSDAEKIQELTEFFATKQFEQTQAMHQVIKANAEVAAALQEAINVIRSHSGSK